MTLMVIAVNTMNYIVKIVANIRENMPVIIMSNIRRDSYAFGSNFRFFT